MDKTLRKGKGEDTHTIPTQILQVKFHSGTRVSL